MKNTVIKNLVYLSVVGVSFFTVGNMVDAQIDTDMSVGTSNLKILGSDRENADLGEFDEMEDIKKQGRSRITEKEKREAQNKKSKKNITTKSKAKNKTDTETKASKEVKGKNTTKKSQQKSNDIDADDNSIFEGLDSLDPAGSDLDNQQGQQEELEFLPAPDPDINGSDQNDDLITDEDIDVGFEEDSKSDSIPGPDYGKMYNDKFEKERSKSGIMMDDSFYETPPPQSEDGLLDTQEYDSVFGNGF